MSSIWLVVYLSTDQYDSPSYSVWATEKEARNAKVPQGCYIQDIIEIQTGPKVTFGADEDHGEDVRNALAGSDIIPGFTGRNDPFKDWAMMQKGYQGMRMMNNSDDFDAETKKVRRHRLDRFTRPKKPGRAYYESRGRRFAIKDLLAAEDGASVIIHSIRDIDPECLFCDETEAEMIEVELDGYMELICEHCADPTNWMAEQVNEKKIRTLSGKPLKLRKLAKDKDLKPEDAIERLEISAESTPRMTSEGLTVYFIETITHDGHLWGDAGCLDYNDVGPYATKEGAEAALNKMLEQEVREWEGRFDDLGAFTYEITSDGDMRLKPPNMNLDEFQWEYSMPTNKSIHDSDGLIYEAGIRPRQIMAAEGDQFNAQVYRGKPFEELGYAERAVLHQKMLEAAEIEQAIINLEAAVRMGLISEDEVMRSLVERFGA